MITLIALFHPLIQNPSVPQYFNLVPTFILMFNIILADSNMTHWLLTLLGVDMASQYYLYNKDQSINQETKMHVLFQTITSVMLVGTVILYFNRVTS